MAASTLPEKKELQAILKTLHRQLPEVYLVYAKHDRTKAEHVLNVFDTLEAAKEQCKQWQAQHRQWYEGLNQWEVFVRSARLNANGPGALNKEKVFAVLPDWD
jgi:hypothetical protein